MADPIPYWRFFVGAFTAETGHLTAVQLGHHVRLLMLAWRRASCSIPDDAVWLCQRLRIGPDEFARNVVPLLADLWESDGEDLHNADQRAERFYVEQRSERARQAALIRYGGGNIHPLKTKVK